MKPAASVLSFLLLLLLTYWAFQGAMPPYRSDAGAPDTSFSTDRALEHVRAIAQEPHAVGFPAHGTVRAYIQESLRGMGLEPQLQSGYTAGDWGNHSKAVNILARIEGNRPGKALLLLSHYDSNPHSSLGAGDAGSGVAVILEGVRAFLAQNKTPENDIIILISDAEELGLNGADLFANHHPWAEDVGLVLNFEARGSGGPGIMLLETNGGNSELIRAFTEAGPDFPVANSLAYSIYKMMPNDTDLTVFRKDRDIEGFNFAFIGDHYDYHTALDTYQRLDRNTLAHQGSYLVPLLDYFSRVPLDRLKSQEDWVYFNLPFYGLLSYPFSWIWPLYLAGAILFLVLLIRGFRTGSLSQKGVLTGWAPMLLCLLINGLAGYIAWPMLGALYPAYGDMLHGFTYNGYLYIAAWAAFAAGSCFLVYSRFSRLSPADALVAPAAFWLVVCGLLNHFLEGAAFFLIPGLALLMMLLFAIRQENPNPYFLTALGIPALWILAPLVKLFPEGLGLKMMIAATLMTTFIFLLLLGILQRYPNKGRYGWLGLLVFLGLLAGAHFQSGFDTERPKPTSLLYALDADSGQAYWATYEKAPAEWTRAYLKDAQSGTEALGSRTLSSKYSTGFTQVSRAPVKDVPAPEFRMIRDTVIAGERRLSLEVVSRRAINRLEIFTNETPLTEARVCGLPLEDAYLQNRRGGKLITRYVSHNQPTRLDLVFPAESHLELTIYEASNDLLSNPLFSVPPRPAEAIPMPFVLNDAVMLIKTLRFD